MVMQVQQTESVSIARKYGRTIAHLIALSSCVGVIIYSLGICIGAFFADFIYRNDHRQE
jgi:hypothetical protein